MPPYEIMELFPQDDADARRRMVEILTGAKIDSMKEQLGNELRSRRVPWGEDADDYFNVVSGGVSWYLAGSTSDLGKKSTRQRAIRAVVLLEKIGSPEALEILTEMSKGLEDAAPTILAREVALQLKRGFRDREE